MIDTLDSKLDQAIEKTMRPDYILGVLLVNYLSEKKIVFFPWQVKRFVRQAESENATIKLFWFNRIFCRLSTTELEEYVRGFLEYANRAAEKFQDHFQETFDTVTVKVVEDSAKRILKSMFRTSSAMIRNRRMLSRKSRKVVAEVWGDALHVLRMEIEMAKEIYEDTSEGALDGGGLKWRVMVKLFEQSCLVSLEIYTLLENGFPDAALARWRTLHETAVVFHFVHQNDEIVAQMFLEHQIVANYREMSIYVRKQDELGLERLEPDEQSRIEAEYRAALQKYGAKYKEDYGWASTVIKSDRIHFSDIEKNVGQDYLKPYYKLASNNVHAGAKGVYYKIGVVDHEEGLVGESFIGLGDPIQLLSLSLCSITTGILSEVGTFTGTVEIKILGMLSENLQELIPELVEAESDE